MSHEEYREKVIFELGKITEWTENLKDHATNEKINRIQCIRILNDISLSMSNANFLLEKMPGTKKASPSQKAATKKIDELTDSINSLAENIENTTTWEESLLRSKLFQLSRTLTSIILGMDLGFRKKFGLPAISSIGSFIANKSLNLTEPWVIANCYLAAIDVTVNKLREKFKIAHPTAKKEMNTPFDQRYQQLVDEMKKNGYTISEVLGSLANHFWDMRTKIIHYGFVPNQKELQLIVDYSKEILKMLLAKKPKSTK